MNDTSETKNLSLAVLISGGGRSLMNLHDRIGQGALSASIRVVVSSRAEAAGVAKARAAGLNVVVADRKSLSAEEFQQRITDAVRGVDLVCMAGFLSLWRIPSDHRGRVINIHPALLPEFGGRGMYGSHVHEAVLKAGRAESGCTVHFCDDEYDRGPTILQRRVAVRPDDTPETLAARVFEQECLALPEAIELFAQGRIRWEQK